MSKSTRPAQPHGEAAGVPSIEPTKDLRELIEFIEGVAFQALWNGRAREKFHQVVFALKESTVIPLYNELLLSVGKKHPNESRHETALRYIRAYEAIALIDAEAHRPERGTKDPNEPDPREHANELAVALIEARKELVEIRPDAARYRWLRDMLPLEILSNIFNKEAGRDPEGEMDAVIDAARIAEGGLK